MENEQPAQPQENDISSRTLTVLVVLTLAVSFIGAWASMSQVMLLSGSPVQPSTTAQVSFVIEEPPQPSADNAAGKVAFEIMQPSG